MAQGFQANPIAQKLLLITSNSQTTVSAHIRRRRLIKLWRFQGGGLFEILGFLPKKSLNNWTFGAKKWWVNQIWLYWWFYWEWRGYGMHSLTMRTKNTCPMFILLCIRSGKLSRHFTDKSLQCVIKNDLYTSLFTPNTEYTLPLDESNSNMISIGTKCIFNCTCFRVHLTI